MGQAGRPAGLRQVSGPRAVPTHANRTERRFASAARSCAPAMSPSPADPQHRRLRPGRGISTRRGGFAHSEAHHPGPAGTSAAHSSTPGSGAIQFRRHTKGPHDIRAGPTRSALSAVAFHRLPPGRRARHLPVLPLAGSGGATSSHRLPGPGWPGPARAGPRLGRDDRQPRRRRFRHPPDTC